MNINSNDAVTAEVVFQMFRLPNFVKSDRFFRRRLKMQKRKKRSSPADASLSWRGCSAYPDWKAPRDLRSGGCGVSRRSPACCWVDGAGPSTWLVCRLLVLGVESLLGLGVRGQLFFGLWLFISDTMASMVIGYLPAPVRWLVRSVSLRSSNWDLYPPFNSRKASRFTTSQLEWEIQCFKKQKPKSLSKSSAKAHSVLLRSFWAEFE